LHNQVQQPAFANQGKLDKGRDTSIENRMNDQRYRTYFIWLVYVNVKSLMCHLIKLVFDGFQSG